MKLFKMISASFVLAIAASGVMAADLPISKVDPSQTGFDTVIDCSRAAIEAASEVSRSYEAAGMIYKYNGKYYYTLPVSQGSSHDVNYRVILVANAVRVGLYHTHPGKENDVDRLSDNDYRLAKAQGLQMFVGVLELSHILVYQSKTGNKFDYPMTNQKPTNVDRDIEEMLKDHKPKDVILQYMKTNAVLWDAARTRVNSVIEHHIAVQQMIDMERKLETL